MSLLRKISIKLLKRSIKYGKKCNKKKFNKITVACHDAGGSEIICSLLKEKKINFFAFVSYSARKIFKKHFKILKKSNLNFALNNSDYLLTGTSIKSKFELNIILKAKKKIYLLNHFLIIG